MKPIPYATEIETTYENFLAKCPHCNFMNIFNRITDLKDTNPIDFKEVKCLFEACGKPFNINGDLVSPAYKMLILDCYILKKEKKYSYCILNLAQSFEMFFSLYLRKKLLYKPFSAQRVKLEKLNEISSLLFETIKKYPYKKMRNIFTNTVLSKVSVQNLNDSELIINSLKDLVSDSSDDIINRESDEKLRSLLIKLKASKVPILRNKVVHKHAYRPTLVEVESTIEETESIIYGLASNLDTKFDNINCNF